MSLRNDVLVAQKSFLWICACLFPIMAAADPSVGEWPRLVGGKNPYCAVAHQFAKQQFASDNWSTSQLPAISPGATSAVVLGSSLSVGGDPRFFDEDVFEEIPTARNESPGAIYWQKIPTDRRRLVIVSKTMGWRGDMYTVLSVMEDLTPDNVVGDIAATAPSGGAVVLLSGIWVSPVVFRDSTSGAIWFIDHGAYAFGALPNWDVYSPGPGGIAQQCSIQFWPPAKRGIDLLPLQVRKLATLLDQSLGSGENEGSLQPTARLRGDANITWANVASRPWAVWRPYNSRNEVDFGLKAWSRRNSQLYGRILRQYPLAQQSLTSFYMKRFGFSSKDAGVLASHVLDAAFRSNFVFAKDEMDRYTPRNDEAPNPWPTLRP